LHIPVEQYEDGLWRHVPNRELLVFAGRYGNVNIVFDISQTIKNLRPCLINEVKLNTASWDSVDSTMRTLFFVKHFILGLVNDLD
jgi:hypothetical protein